MFIKPLETFYIASAYPPFHLYAILIPLYEHFVSPPSTAFLPEVLYFITTTHQHLHKSISIQKLTANIK